jgi:hypothetical protein
MSSWHDILVAAHRQSHAVHVVISNLLPFYLRGSAMAWSGMRKTLVISGNSAHVSFLSAANTARAILAARVEFFNSLTIPTTVKIKGRVLPVVFYCEFCDNPDCPNADLVTIDKHRKPL